ncbi:hypothetical protein M758_4G045700 [Ceratodon purpureus]|nr:hypothetical protein M758_4G045700 [Ceratodon purpureus]
MTRVLMILSLGTLELLEDVVSSTICRIACGTVWKPAFTTPRQLRYRPPKTFKTAATHGEKIQQKMATMSTTTENIATIPVMNKRKASTTTTKTTKTADSTSVNATAPPTMITVKQTKTTEKTRQKKTKRNEHTRMISGDTMMPAKNFHGEVVMWRKAEARSFTTVK